MTPSEELQGLIVTTAKVDPVLVGFLAGRIYDGRPDDHGDPYATFGPAFITPNDAECIVASDHNRQIDVWNREGGQVECGRICDGFKQAFHDQTFTLADNAIGTVTVSYRVLPDPDGVTWHGVVSLTAFIEET